MTAFTGWGEGSSCSCFKKDVADAVVAGNPIAVLGTPQGMISHFVILCSTGWANAISTVEGDTKPVFEGGSELWSPEMKAQSWAGYGT